MTWPPCLFWKSDFPKPVPTDYLFCFAPKARKVAHLSANFHNAVVCPPVNKMQEQTTKNFRLLAARLSCSGCHAYVLVSMPQTRQSFRHLPQHKSHRRENDRSKDSN